MAICDANCEFIMCDFGVNGRISDGGVIAYTQFYKKLKSGSLRLPQPSNPQNSQRELPFVFIGDEAFALRTDFLKPYSRRDLDHDRKIFNYRLSRGRSKIENSFGILSARFQVFQTAIRLHLESIDKVVMACCVLHNFLRRKCGKSYTPPECFDQEKIMDGTVQVGQIQIFSLVCMVAMVETLPEKQIKCDNYLLSTLIKKVLFLGKNE
ncbi:unnamed protein product [Acanthoscelides obtectus]|uniref:DDE Tnp4 domain-containing protein n=1 Tax=Acanthoscelides obtectus TaxID=200917 RepID=A0A9P0LHG7_ACAOB|nr:unnamed protein product [Acanthoscelides obtectus]CAK1680604.1 Protein ALP1-like [Acanthoscelides obtectus]